MLWLGVQRNHHYTTQDWLTSLGFSIMLKHCDEINVDRVVKRSFSLYCILYYTHDGIY